MAKTGMSIRATERAIRALGLTCRYSHAFGEYRVNVPGGSEDTAYYTNDAFDALSTARTMKVLADSIAQAAQAS